MIPASAMTLVQRTVSLRTSVPNSSGVPPPGSVAELGERLAHLIALERLVDRFVQPRGDVGRRAGLHQESGPIFGGKLRVACLGDGRHILQGIEPFVADHRQRPELTGVDELHHRKNA